MDPTRVYYSSGVFVFIENMTGNSQSLGIPNVGSRVEVTIEERNQYYHTYKTEPYIKRVYVGTVLPNESWQKSTTFSLTGDEHIRQRVIDISDVADIKYYEGSAGIKFSSDIRSFVVKSKNNKYLVTLRNKKFDCSCIGFQYHKNCKHIKAVAKKIEK